MLRAATVLVWWWLMMAVHELGHVLGCCLSGATIEAVVLWPWTISETVRSGSAAPLLDTWAGPLFGAGLPVVLWWALRRRPFDLRTWVGGWAGFCLVANGVYLGVGWLDQVGDAGDLLRLGMPAYVLALSGAVLVAAGLALWHVLLQETRRTQA